MARIPGIALLGALLLITACRAETLPDAPVAVESATPRSALTAPALEVTPTAEPTRAAPLSATATPAPEPQPEARLSTGEPLAKRFPAAVALIEAAPQRVGVAVRTPDREIYIGGDDGPFALASVVKVPVMIATFERARLAGRALTVEERTLLRQMITLSENEATDALWHSLGGGPGLATLLEPLGVAGIDYAPDHQWGDSLATPFAVIKLLDLLADEASPLGTEARLEALALMREVAADQRWGASAGVDLSTGAAATLAIKNGWYPEPDGWLLNTAGVLSTDAAASIHVIVVLTEGARTQTEGVWTIESIAAAINHAIVPPALVVAPQRRIFAAAPLPNTPSVAADSTADAVEPAGELEAEPAPTALVAFAQSDDVLVPAGGVLIGSAADSTELTLWYEVADTTADQLLATYADSMLELGWLEVAGPPSVVLSKSAEGRWVGFSTLAGSGGTRLVQVTISPAPGVQPAGIGAP